jgi:hypothetical protein
MDCALTIHDAKVGTFNVLANSMPMFTDRTPGNDFYIMSASNFYQLGNNKITT